MKRMKNFKSFHLQYARAITFQSHCFFSLTKMKDEKNENDRAGKENGVPLCAD